MKCHLHITVKGILVRNSEEHLPTSQKVPVKQLPGHTQKKSVSLVTTQAAPFWHGSELHGLTGKEKGCMSLVF